MEGDARPLQVQHQLHRFEKSFVNWDCSTTGFEGIRGQDILPLLLQSFRFEAFVAYSNLINVFVDRCFGHNFDAKNPEDIAFIERIGAPDEQLIDEGKIKPTQMIAVMRVAPGESPRYYRHWSAEFCVRPPGVSK